MLTLIVFIPLVAVLILLFVNKEDTGTIKSVSVGAAGLSLLISLALLVRFDSMEPSMQFTETFAWVPIFNINYQMGVDGISLWLLVLTAFISFIAVCFSLDRKEGLKMSISKDFMQLSVNSPTSGEGIENIDVKFNSDDMTISFNSRYLIDIASQIEGDSIVINLKDPASPVLIKDFSDQNSFYVVMPMKI